ncbi:hypothetical protein JAAARDRAFT_403812 [Jaapia argillacea MUCL 33604]|uniref:Uncharacterized protein n=1 Tax=Jaapia argillacea MUCL 33604 TaxID=933084 RepID=A0A067PSJ3_9AGAM|nr:hypothetical protein JAAARDRAFT_403812 [Jaapia argillacea MUCL 33604]
MLTGPNVRNIFDSQSQLHTFPSPRRSAVKITSYHQVLHPHTHTETSISTPEAQAEISKPGTNPTDRIFHTYCTKHKYERSVSLSCYPSTSTATSFPLLHELFLVQNRTISRTHQDLHSCALPPIRGPRSILPLAINDSDCVTKCVPMVWDGEDFYFSGGGLGLRVIETFGDRGRMAVVYRRSLSFLLPRCFYSSCKIFPILRRCYMHLIPLAGFDVGKGFPL